MKERKKGWKVVMEVMGERPKPALSLMHMELPTHCVMVSGTVWGISNLPLALQTHTPH